LPAKGSTLAESSKNSSILSGEAQATSRLVDNRHFLSDLMFGAGVGVATGWTVVGRHGRTSYAFQQVPVPGGMMVALTRVED